MRDNAVWTRTAIVEMDTNGYISKKQGQDLVVLWKCQGRKRKMNRMLLFLACGVEYWWCLSCREEAVTEDQVGES